MYIHPTLKLFTSENSLILVNAEVMPKHIELLW